MIKLTIPPEDVEKLRHERFHHPHPLVQRKSESLLLKHHNLPHHKIAEILNSSCSKKRVMGQGGASEDMFLPRGR